MAILSMMVDNLTSIMSGKVRVKSAHMKKSRSHNHVKKTEFVEDNADQPALDLDIIDKEEQEDTVEDFSAEIPSP